MSVTLTSPNGNTYECLETDSKEYEILIDSIIEIKGVEGITCEIGLRSGGGSTIIMAAGLINDDKRLHIAIDPYGNIDYLGADNTAACKHDYTNNMKLLTLYNIYKFCCQYGSDFLFFNMEDIEFFKRYADGIPIYNETKSIVSKYALIFFDGPHTTDAIQREIEFFKGKTPIGGIWVFDDVSAYNRKKIDDLVKSWGFKVFKQGNTKMSYIKYE